MTPPFQRKSPIARTLVQAVQPQIAAERDALERLPELINGADAVLCPTDCVSDTAYYKLKQHCKRTGKPCLLFKGAGVSGFAVALARLSAGQASIAGA